MGRKYNRDGREPAALLVLALTRILFLDSRRRGTGRVETYFMPLEEVFRRYGPPGFYRAQPDAWGLELEEFKRQRMCGR